MATATSTTAFQPTFRRIAQQGRHDDAFAVLAMLTGKTLDSLHCPHIRHIPLLPSVADQQRVQPLMHVTKHLGGHVGAKATSATSSA